MLIGLVGSPNGGQTGQAQGQEELNQSLEAQFHAAANVNDPGPIENRKPARTVEVGKPPAVGRAGAKTKRRLPQYPAADTIASALTAWMLGPSLTRVSPKA